MADYQHYQLRISRSYSDLGLSLLQFYDKCEYGFVFEHGPDQDANRDHIHAYCFNMSIKYDAIHGRIEKLGYKGNSDFSILGTCGGKKRTRPLDLSGAWCYGSKYGTLRPVYLKNISDEVVEELNEYSRRFAPRDQNTAVTPAQPSEPKPKQKTKYQQMKEIAELVISPEFVKITSRVERIRVVRDMTLQYLRDNQIYSGGKYKVCELIESVLMDLEDESFTRAVTLQLEKSLLPI